MEKVCQNLSTSMIRTTEMNKDLYPTISVASLDEVPVLLQLQREAFRPRAMELDWIDAFPMVEGIDSALKEFHRNTTFKLALPDGTIIGSIRGCMEDPNTLYLSRLMVHPDHKGQGYGTRLMLYILEVMPHRKAWLYVSELEPNVVKMYERLGFHEFGREPGERDTEWIMMERINPLPQE